MKKKRVGKGDEIVSGEYVVGQVCSSLSQSKKQDENTHLSALFHTGVNTLQFVPVPQLPVFVEAETKHSRDEEEKMAKKKVEKQKSAAQMKLEERESSLQHSDVELQQPKRKVCVRSQQKKRLNRAEERVKNKRTVFVGNLPVRCTKKTLQNLFRELGHIESIRFRSATQEDPKMSRKEATIKRKVTPVRNNINAYVVFNSEDGAVSALQRNGTEIEKGFHIRVDLASKANSHDHKRSVFVGNLPYDVNELPMRQHFEECGPVESVRVIRDRNTGMGKGFGYVLFERSDSVLLALKLDGSELLGRRVRVKRSVKKDKVKKDKVKKDKVKTRTAGGGTSQSDRNKLHSTRPQHKRKRPSFKGETAKPGKTTKKSKRRLKKLTSI